MGDCGSAQCGDRAHLMRGYKHQLRRLHRHAKPPGQAQRPAAGDHQHQLWGIGKLSGIGLQCLHQRALPARRSAGCWVFVSAGDAGADTSDQFYYAAVSGINTSGFATTPNNVAIGGTDFSDSFFGTNSTYWSATNGPYYNSALSYIPEIPWNDSCASQLITVALGLTQSYGPTGSCNNFPGDPFSLGVIAGSGGPSACAFGVPAIPGVVGGQLLGLPKTLFPGGVR